MLEVYYYTPTVIPQEPGVEDETSRSPNNKILTHDTSGRNEEPCQNVKNRGHYKHKGGRNVEVIRLDQDDDDSVLSYLLPRLLSLMSNSCIRKQIL